jgi:2-phospho-L-lactate/phosphoenolpyruvate guanylyltransferase
MYVVLLPVKPPAIGKSRLAGLPDDERRALAEAFAFDTVSAALAATSVAGLLVVTDDAVLSAELTAVGCATIPDGVTGDLNGTLRLAASEAARRWPELVPVALCADLPALQGSELDEALGQITPGETSYVADADGSGTTLYTAAYDEFAPRFGAGSAEAHSRHGARALAGELPGLRRDVDDLDDLRAALVLGVGPRTRRRAASLAGDGPSS